jgi:glutathione S-transferase
MTLVLLSGSTHMPDPSSPALRLHRFERSGHCHRVQLLLSLLRLPYELIEVDLAAGAQRLPAFLAMNPFGQVPVLEDGELILADSNAILIYLAQEYGGPRWNPTSPVRAAAVQRWLSVAAGPLAFGPAAARAAVLFGAPCDLLSARSRARDLFTVFDAELAHRLFLAGDAVSIADIANYTYVAHAPVGGVSLTPYPRIRGWLAAIEALPAFVPMRASPIVDAA